MVTYQVAGLTIRVTADLPITAQTFAPKFDQFLDSQPDRDMVKIHHHFTLLPLSDFNLNSRVYREMPWAIYQDGPRWVYLGIAQGENDPSPWRLAVFNRDHTEGQIYSPDDNIFRQGNLQSLTLLPTDQIVLARVLADRNGCYLHASGMVINGQGLLFVGHSGAGKSTMIKLLQGQGQILCDDRVILRRWPEGFKVHGSWSHGEIPIVSNASAPLRAILLLEQAPHNRLIPIQERGEIVRRLPFFVIKPLVTADWWEKTLDLVGQIAREVPVYRLQFNKSGGVNDLIQDLLS